MKRLAILGIIACVGLLVGSAVVIGGPAGPPDGLDVKVVHPIPLPVEGDVNATVTGDVNATVTGDVNVANTPLPVTISNQEKTLIDFLNAGSSGEDDVSIPLTDVPSGQMLVITDIDLVCRSTDCRSFRLQLQERETGSSGPFTNRYQSVDLREDERRYNLHLNSGISIDSEMSLRVYLVNNGSENIEYQVLVSGYFVNE